MIRVMTIDDYDEVYALWKKIRGISESGVSMTPRGCGSVPEEKSDDECSGSERREDRRKYPLRS